MALFCRHVPPGVCALLLLRWASSYPGPPSILARRRGRPALPPAVPLALRVLLYATRGVSCRSRTSYGPSRFAFCLAFSSPILPFGVDGSRHFWAGVAYGCAPRGRTWPPRLLCSILFSGLRGPFSDALSALPCVRPLRGRASGVPLRRASIFSVSWRRVAPCFWSCALGVAYCLVGSPTATWRLAFGWEFA